jgi:hypothetical protein
MISVCHQVRRLSALARGTSLPFIGPPGPDLGRPLVERLLQDGLAYSIHC